MIGLKYFASVLKFVYTNPLTIEKGFQTPIIVHARFSPFIYQPNCRKSRQSFPEIEEPFLKFESDFRKLNDNFIFFGQHISGFSIAELFNLTTNKYCFESDFREKKAVSVYANPLSMPNKKQSETMQSSYHSNRMLVNSQKESSVSI